MSELGRKGASAVVMVGALAAAALLVGWGGIRFLERQQQAAPQTVLHRVDDRAFLLQVVERGEVESSSNVEVRCEVKARNSAGTAILEVVPEGTHVKKGDLLARLDASALEQERIQQQIACNTTEATMIQGRNLFEAAQIAREEYLNGTFIQERQVIQNEIILAEENLRRAQQYAKFSERLAARGYVTSLQLEGDRFAVQKAQNELDTARTKLKVLEDYNRPKMLRQLESDIKTAEAKWKSDQSSYELELSKLKDIENQIRLCTILAPADGQVVYANQQGGRGQNEFIVEAGAILRERQEIVRLPDPAQMQVTAKINEARVTLVRPGMPAAIRVDALGDRILQGEVIKVNEYPEPAGWFSSQVKEYKTLVRILDPPRGIRPGLTAEVSIEVDQRPSARQVPVQAIHEHGKTFYCIVRSGDTWAARPVTVNITNDKFAVLDSGLEVGEEVAMDPRAVLKYVDLPKAEVPAKQSAEILAQGTRSKESSQEDNANPANGKGPLFASDRRNSPTAEANSVGTGGPGAENVGSGGVQSPDRQSGNGPDSGNRRGRRRGPGGEPGGNFDPAQIVDRIFSRLDADNNGAISSTELPAEQAARFGNADTDGDGSITRAELTAAMAQMRGQMGGGAPAGGIGGGGGGGGGGE